MQGLLKKRVNMQILSLNLYILIPFLINLAQKYYFEENLNSKYVQNNPHVEKSEQNPIVCHKIYVITCTFSQKLNEIQDQRFETC